MLKTLKLIKKTVCVISINPRVLVPFFGETEHFSGRNGAFWWSILVGKINHNVQKPIAEHRITAKKKFLSKYRNTAKKKKKKKKIGKIPQFIVSLYSWQIR